MVYKYKSNKLNTSLNFQYDKDCFIPTATSDFIIKSASNYISNKSNLLDLGCGVGIVGISLFKMNLIKKLYSSDISIPATSMCKINSENHNVENDVRCGSVFESWKGMSFDNIADDVSGISKHIAAISPWFSNVACDSGDDGTDLTIQILNEASEYLNDKGQLFFPVISLSNHEKIIKTANSVFKNVKKISSNKWFLPDEISTNHNDYIHDLKNSGFIDFEEKFGKKISFTDIYMVNH
jgi:methylase of polypeptide subunit release factors